VKLYLDDDIAWGLLAKLLRKAGHDVQLPSEIGMVGQPDPVHLTHAIRDDRICVTKNYDDYWLLHALLMQAKGTHPGIVVIRQENDPTRDLSAKGIVRAIRKLEAAGVPIANEYIVLNHWR
jgi:predicted nuclease of predicted toxin-antitoxin system